MEREVVDTRDKILILGAGQFAEEVAELVWDTGAYEVVGFVEGQDTEERPNTLLGLPVLRLADIARADVPHLAICAIGTPERRGLIERVRAEGMQFATIVHPRAHVSSTASLGVGSIIGVGAVVACGTRIGEHSIVNRGCLIGHHVQVGDYATLSPGANIAGRTRVGDDVYVGMGAIIIDGLAIGSGSVVAAGAVVTRDVPDRVRVMGIPARVVKELD